MPIVTLDSLAATLPSDRRLLGFDVGTKTIGLALSDSGRRIATPLETLRRRKFTSDAQKLIDIVHEHDAGGLIVGLPLNMDGSQGPRCQSVRQFAANLLEKIDRPLAFWDERLSTQAVTRTLLTADASRRRRAQLVDKMAAAYILQGALDYLVHRAAAGNGGPSRLR